ncbi:hypothetical protein BDP27DRAFT_1430368 [Rhodocollybia butyracea]|uniref:Uncharacterized protein n=1 Tax=Rhodocollybia butyracea TaxID=206335 RepID=A0A9P5PBQ2_9AGAR|nr:hypothetical protein BDP27DRAFT_1430368 [Rhodocollybia butyracea]
MSSPYSLVSLKSFSASISISIFTLNASLFTLSASPFTFSAFPHIYILLLPPLPLLAHSQARMSLRGWSMHRMMGPSSSATAATGVVDSYLNPGTTSPVSYAIEPHPSTLVPSSDPCKLYLPQRDGYRAPPSIDG